MPIDILEAEGIDPKKFYEYKKKPIDILEKEGIDSSEFDSLPIKVLKTIKGMPYDALQGALGIPQGILNGAASILNLPLELIGSNKFRFKAPHVPGFNEESLVGKITSSLSSFIPSMALVEPLSLVKAASLIPKYKNLFSAGKILSKDNYSLNPIVKGGVVGTLSTDGNLDERFIGGSIGAGIPILGKGIEKFSKDFYKLSPNILSKNLYEKINDGLKGTNGLNKQVARSVLKNFYENKKTGVDLFKNFLNESELKGFDKNVNKLNPESKYIKENYNLSKLLEKLEEEKTLQKYIYNFRDNPSIHNAHELQSILFKEKNSILRNPNSTRTELRELAPLLEEAREHTLNSIENSIKSDKNLSKLFKSARDYWRENVVPYSDTRKVVLMQKGGNFPKNMINFLENDDEFGRFDKIRKDISSNSDQANKLLALHLSEIINKDTKGNVSIDAKKLLSHYSKLSDNIVDIIPKETINEISNIEKNKKIIDRLKNVSLFGAGLAGFNKIKNLKG